MNTWFTRAAAGLLAFAALNLSSCKKDESQVVLTTAAAPTLTASTTAPDLVLTTTNANAAAATFTYSAADFGFPAATTYTLQIDKKGGNFSSPQSFTAGSNAGTVTLTKSQLANAYFNLGTAYGATAQVDARIVASVSAAAPTQASPVVTLTATPTPVCVPNTSGRTWSLIGPAGADWTTDKALTYDCYTQTFKANLKLNVGEFKFRANNDWTVNFGVSAATSTVTTSSLASGVSLVNNNNNLQITTAGTYNIVLAPSADGTTGTVIIKP